MHLTHSAHAAAKLPLFLFHFREARFLAARAWLQGRWKSWKKKAWAFSYHHPWLAYIGTIVALPLLLIGAVGLFATLCMLPIGLIFGF